MDKNVQILRRMGYEVSLNHEIPAYHVLFRTNNNYHVRFSVPFHTMSDEKGVEFVVGHFNYMIKKEL